jgi:hypothetical protein
MNCRVAWIVSVSRQHAARNTRFPSATAITFSAPPAAKSQNVAYRCLAAFAFILVTAFWYAWVHQLPFFHYDGRKLSQL